MKISNILLAVILGVGLIGNAVAVLNDGLVAHYPFNGNANDESGNGNDGTEYGRGDDKNSSLLGLYIYRVGADKKTNT